MGGVVPDSVAVSLASLSIQPAAAAIVVGFEAATASASTDASAGLLGAVAARGPVSRGDMCVGRALRSGDLYAGRALGRALLARRLGASWLVSIRPGRRADSRSAAGSDPLFGAAGGVGATAG